MIRVEMGQKNSGYANWIKFANPLVQPCGSSSSDDSGAEIYQVGFAIYDYSSSRT